MNEYSTNADRAAHSAALCVAAGCGRERKAGVGSERGAAGRGAEGTAERLRIVAQPVGFGHSLNSFG